MTEATVLPTEDQKKAAAVIDTMLDKALGTNVDVEIKKGAQIKVFKEGASEDTLQIIVKSDKFVETGADPEHYAKLALKELQKLYSIRDNAIVVSPKEYLEFGASEVKALEHEAEKLGIKHEGVDLSKTVALRTDIAQSQKTRYASQYISNPSNSVVRIQVPTNPDKLEEAEALAQKILKDIEGRLPEIKAGMIDRIKKKNYKTLTPEQEKHLQDHEFKVSMQQQGNWTSVFLEIRSPEQVHAREHPEEKTEPQKLQATNMLEQIENADSRTKLAARAVLYQGNELKKPASYYTDVAGTDDVKMVLTKMVEDLKKKNTDPKLHRRADALLKENFLISNELWNLPPDQQPTFKQVASAVLKPGTNEIRITLNVPRGKADQILKEISAPENALVTAPVPVTEVKPIEAPAIDAAVAAAVAACPPNEIAVAGAVGAAADGAAGAGAVAACVEKPPVTIGRKTFEPNSPVAQQVTPEMAANFLKSKAEQVAGRKEENSYVLGA